MLLITLLLLYKRLTFIDIKIIKSSKNLLLKNLRNVSKVFIQWELRLLFPVTQASADTGVLWLDTVIKLKPVVSLDRYEFIHALWTSVICFYFIRICLTILCIEITMLYCFLYVLQVYLNRTLPYVCNLLYFTK